MFTNVNRPSAVDVLRPFTVGDQFYADTTTTLAKLAIGSTNDVLTVTGGVPVWSSSISLTTLTVVDSGFSVVGSADATKRMVFEVDGQTANDTLTFNTGAQTDSRTLTVPVLTGNRTLAVIDQAQAFTAAQTITPTLAVGNSSSGDGITINHFLSQTPITLQAGTLPSSGGRIGLCFSGGATSNNTNRYAVTAYATENWVSGGASGTEIRLEVAATGASSRTNAALVSATAFTIPGTFNVTTAGARYAFNVSGAYLNWMEADGVAGNNYIRWGVGNTEYMRLNQAGVLTLPGTTDSTTKDTGTIVTEGGIGVEKAIYAGTAIRSVSPTAGIGYATGAGGTATQGSGSGKATTVTLNTICGTITMDGANLNADTTVAFTFTNSAIASTDLVVIQHSSVGTLGAYNFAVTPGSGTATISVRNVTPGNLAEAIVLRFAIIKAVTA